MAQGSSGFRLVGILVLVTVLAAVWWWLSPPSLRTATDSRLPAAAREAQRVPPAEVPARAGESHPPAQVSGVATPAPDGSADADAAALGLGWASVNLDDVRKEMPDNLYWKMSVPTDDPDILKWREEERARWNVEYGKVLSGTASEDEIRAYYDRRAQLAGDYVEFATYLLDHYSESLSERDVNLLNLAVKLNRARLEEIPRKVEEAMARKQKQDAARAQWLADQAAFGGDGSAPDSNTR